MSVLTEQRWYKEVESWLNANGWYDDGSQTEGLIVFISEWQKEFEIALHDKGYASDVEVRYLPLVRDGLDEPVLIPFMHLQYFLSVVLGFEDSKNAIKEEVIEVEDEN